MYFIILKKLWKFRRKQNNRFGDKFNKFRIFRKATLAFHNLQNYKFTKLQIICKVNFYEDKNHSGQNDRKS